MISRKKIWQSILILPQIFRENKSENKILKLTVMKCLESWFHPKFLLHFLYPYHYYSNKILLNFDFTKKNLTVNINFATNFSWKQKWEQNFKTYCDEVLGIMVSSQISSSLSVPLSLLSKQNLLQGIFFLLEWHSSIQSFLIIFPLPFTWLNFGVFKNAHTKCVQVESQSPLYLAPIAIIGKRIKKLLRSGYYTIWYWLFSYLDQYFKHCGPENLK